MSSSEPSPPARTDPVGRDARRARVVRGTIAAAVATTLAATAHTLGGGTPPAWWLIAAVTALILPVSVLLIGRRASTLRTVLAVCAAQAALHSMYAAVGGATPALATRVGHAAHHAPVVLTTSAAHLHVDAAMIATHLIAAAVTIALLVRGEAAARALAQALVQAVRTGIRRLLHPVLIPAPRCAPALSVLSVERIRTTAPFLAAISRRGPPLPSL